MSNEDTLELLEWAGRKCYKSEERIGEGTAAKFVRMLLNRTPPHESVIEHVSATVLFVIDRGVSHELVRHRLASYSQESTRFCDYGDGQIQFVIPPWIDDEALRPGIYDPEAPGWEALRNDKWLVKTGGWHWLNSMLDGEKYYKVLRNECGWTAEQARDVLPVSLKTEVVATYNLRQWRHVFKMRTAEKCHPQMKEVMRPLAKEFAAFLPEVFSGG